jgi:catechol 2,3-dioxygenase-like lactoylglutathione lyase family enzyme
VRAALRTLAALVALAGAVFAGEAPTTASARAGTPLVQSVGSVGFTVADLDRSVRFFVDVLGFTPLDEQEIAGDPWERLSGVFGMRARVARLRLGNEEVELSEYLAPRGRPVPPDARGNDRSFQHVAIVVGDMARAYARLREHRVAHASSGPQRLPDWNPNAGGIEAFYFRDPDGHFLELIAFPPGKGDPRWPRLAAQGGLFLGLDHTAIVATDTDESLKLYRDALGLKVAGESENWGTEQEHLNNVFGARLRITGLRAEAGPGIELLEYLAPRDGRPAPADLRANDLLQWQTCRPARSTARATRRGGGPSSCATATATPFGSRRGESHERAARTRARGR